MCECDYGNNVTSTMRAEMGTYEKQTEPEPGKKTQKNLVENSSLMLDRKLEQSGRLITTDLDLRPSFVGMRMVKTSGLGSLGKTNPDWTRACPQWLQPPGLLQGSCRQHKRIKACTGWSPDDTFAHFALLGQLGWKIEIRQNYFIQSSGVLLRIILRSKAKKHKRI